MLTKLKTDSKLLALIEKSIQDFKALSPEEQLRHRQEQRRSWVRGELMLEYPEMPWWKADKLARDT